MIGAAVRGGSGSGTLVDLSQYRLPKNRLRRRRWRTAPSRDFSATSSSVAAGRIIVGRAEL